MTGRKGRRERIPRTRGYVRREKRATGKLGIKNLTTLEISGSSRRVGEKEDVRERRVLTREGGHRLTKAGEKS